MQIGLFRQQAVEEQQHRLHGDVILMPSLSHVLLSVFICTWLAALIGWLVSSSYARQVSVSGFLEPPDGIVKLYTPATGGKVTSLFVKEGQQVNKGQALMVIATGLDMASGQSLRASLLDEYQQQQTLLIEQRTRIEQVHQMQMLDLTRQQQAISLDRGRLEKQIDTLKSRQNLINRRVETYRAMSLEGHIAKIEFDKAMEQQLALQAERQSLMREQIDHDNRAQQLASKLAILPAEHLNQVNQLKAKLSELSLSIARINSQSEYVVTATRSGKVVNLQHHVGQQLTPSSLLMSLVPIHHDIEVRLLVPVRSAGFINEGQKVEVRYDAFPFQKFGIYQATVRHVSDSILLPQEGSVMPVKFQEPSYLVNAVLESNYVNAYGNPITLKPGMTLSADIRLSERSLLEWLMEPLYSLRGRL